VHAGPTPDADGPSVHRNGADAPYESDESPAVERGYADPGTRYLRRRLREEHAFVATTASTTVATDGGTNGPVGDGRGHYVEYASHDRIRDVT
jgi:hypothetical protein